MSAHAAVKGCVGVAKVLPYILNMFVGPFAAPLLTSHLLA